MVALIFHRSCPFLANRLAGVNRSIEKKWGRGVSGGALAGGRQPGQGGESHLGPGPVRVAGGASMVSAPPHPAGGAFNP